LTTGELVASTYERFADGELPVFELGDGNLPGIFEEAIVGQPIDSDYLVVFPQGTADMPEQLPEDDAYAAIIQLYRFAPAAPA